jgi:hypothetical protein
MRTVKTLLFIIVAGNVFSLLQKTDTVSAFTVSIKDAETVFVNTAMIAIAVFIYLVLRVKVK